MIRPSLQFYPKDWRTDANLRRCSLAARGAAMDVICVMHDSNEYGVLRWPLKEVANAAGVPLAMLRELASKGVLKGGDSFTGEFVYTPKHAGKLGTPVAIVVGDGGPCWFYARLVRDEYVRQRRGESTRFDTANNPASRSPKAAPKAPIGEPQGDGASTASPSPCSKYEASGDTPPSAAVGDRTGVFEGHDVPRETPNPVAAYAIALTRAGFQCTSLHPDLVAYVDAGGTVDHLTQCAGLSECSGKKAAYPIRIARRELAERPPTITGASHEPARPRRLSAVEQVEHAIAERKQREADAGRILDA